MARLMRKLIPYLCRNSLIVPCLQKTIRASDFGLNKHQFSTVVLQKSAFNSNVLRLLRNQIDYLSDYAPPIQKTIRASDFGLKHHQFSTVVLQKSAFNSNVLRLLRNQIDYLSDYAPPIQPAVEFKSFIVEDRPGEQWITMKGNYGEDETIKIEATMFDGSAVVQKSGNDISLHISLLVDISRGEESDLEFVCSAWSDHIEIQKVYIFNRDKSLYQPYMGPNFRNLDTNLQNALAEFLKERGVNDDLSVFLHEYMLNKNKVEVIKWLRKVKYFVEK